MYYYWMFMILAIISEVIGVLAMKYSTVSAPLIGLGVMYFMLIISYTSLAIAVKRIPIAVAYGAWESLGLVLIAIFSYLLFSEPLNATKIIAIIFIIVGIILLERGTDESNHQGIK